MERSCCIKFEEAVTRDPTQNWQGKMASWGYGPGGDCDPYQEGGIYEGLKASHLQNDPGPLDSQQSAALEQVRCSWKGQLEWNCLPAHVGRRKWG